MSRKEKPVRRILISGTPGTGKSTLCAALARHFEAAKVFSVSDAVKADRALQDSYDDKMEAFVMRESSVRRAVRAQLNATDQIVLVECHSPGIFRRRMFDMVVVLTADTAPLFDRLTERGYAAEKREENITAEIMQVCLEEAVDVFGHKRVLALPSNTAKDIQSAIDHVRRRVEPRSLEEGE